MLDLFYWICRSNDFEKVTSNNRSVSFTTNLITTILALIIIALRKVVHTSRASSSVYHWLQNMVAVAWPRIRLVSLVVLHVRVSNKRRTTLVLKLRRLLYEHIWLITKWMWICVLFERDSVNLRRLNVSFYVFYECIHALLRRFFSFGYHEPCLEISVAHYIHDQSFFIVAMFGSYFVGKEVEGLDRLGVDLSFSFNVVTQIETLAKRMRNWPGTARKREKDTVWERENRCNCHRSVLFNIRACNYLPVDVFSFQVI